MFPRSEVVKQFSRLVHKLAHMFDSGNSHDDLYQEGCCGLIEAYDRFDETRDVTFLTYAYPWVYAKMQTYCEQFDVPVKISHGQHTQLRKLSKSNLDVHGIGIASIELTNDMGATDIHREIEARLNSTVLQEAFSRLPDRAKHIVYRHVIDEQTLESIATEMGFSRQYASVIYSRAVRSMKKYLQRKMPAVDSTP